MVPFEPPVRVVPVDGPAEVTGIDVAGETSLVAMELVADEVYLAGQDSVIVLQAQVMSVRRDVTRDLSRIVVMTAANAYRSG